MDYNPVADMEDSKEPTGLVDKENIDHTEAIENKAILEHSRHWKHCVKSHEKNKVYYLID